MRRRQLRVRDRLGEQIRLLRIESGITLRDLSRACGLDPGHVSRIERGLAQPSIDALVAIGACLGAELGVRYFAGSGPRLRDRFQAPIVEALLRTMHPRWIRFPELAVPKARGFVDVAFGLPTGSAGVECEVHSEIRAVDDLLRRQREKALAVADLGVVGSEVSRLLVLRSTKQNRDTVRLHEATFAAAYPGRADHALAALRGDAAPWPGPTLLWAGLAGGRAEILAAPPRGIGVGRGRVRSERDRFG